MSCPETVRNDIQSTEAAAQYKTQCRLCTDGGTLTRQAARQSLARSALALFALCSTLPQASTYQEHAPAHTPSHTKIILKLSSPFRHRAIECCPGLSAVCLSCLCCLRLLPSHHSSRQSTFLSTSTRPDPTLDPTSTVIIDADL